MDDPTRVVPGPGLDDPGHEDGLRLSGVAAGEPWRSLRRWLLWAHPEVARELGPVIFRNAAMRCERCQAVLEHHLHGPMAEHDVIFCPACDVPCQWPECVPPPPWREFETSGMG